MKEVKIQMGRKEDSGNCVAPCMQIDDLGLCGEWSMSRNLNTWDVFWTNQEQMR